MTIQYGELSTETLPSQIAKRMRQAILEGKLAINERLPTEDQLAAQFGVSRPTIREALKRLAAQNLVRSRRGPAGGSFIDAPSLHDARSNLAAVTTMLVGMGQFSLAQFSEVRLSLQTLCVQLAADNHTESHLVTMGEEITLQRSADLTDQDFCASDVRFHCALADAAGNPLLRFLMAAVIEALQPISNLVVFRYRDRNAIASQHERILECLRVKDGGGATQVLIEQSLYLQERYAIAQAKITERSRS